MSINKNEDYHIKEIIEKITPVLKKIGITRVANVTGLDNIGIPVALCIRPNSKHLSVSQGKGLTWELAYVSAVMESLEGYHAENITESHLRGTYSKLQENYSLINPNNFDNGFLKLCEQKTELNWLKGINIVNNKEIHIPREAICLNSCDSGPEKFVFNATSNGLAAGNNITQSILHAVYEIIERNALYNWMHLSDEIKINNQLNILSIKDSTNRETIEKIQTANAFIKIWDITSTLNLPTFLCNIFDMSHRNLGGFYGSGTHLSKQVALSKALLEAVQSRLTFITGTRDEIFSKYYHNRETHIFLDNSNGQKILEYSDNPISNSVAEEFNKVLGLLTSHNFDEVILINHTKPDLNIPVAHVFIPKMNMRSKWKIL